MPKIIENLRESLLTEARRQLFENGYAALNVRAVAKSCHAAVGTLYNYFPSKDILVANIVFADWQRTISSINAAIGTVSDLRTGLEAIYDGILAFNDSYRTIFAESSISPVKYSFSERHRLLCSQIEDMLRSLFSRFGCEADGFTVSFITESMLTGTSNDWEYALLDPIFSKIL